MTARSLFELDNVPQRCTIRPAGREDRATLRSDPSARPGAETWVRSAAPRRTALFQFHVSAFKATNLPAIARTRFIYSSRKSRCPAFHKNRCAKWQDLWGSRAFHASYYGLRNAQSGVAPPVATFRRPLRGLESGWRVSGCPATLASV